MRDVLRLLTLLAIVVAGLALLTWSGGTTVGSTRCESESPGGVVSLFACPRSLLARGDRPAPPQVASPPPDAGFDSHAER